MPFITFSFAFSLSPALAYCRYWWRCHKRVDRAKFCIAFHRDLHIVLSVPPLSGKAITGIRSLCLNDAGGDTAVGVIDGVTDRSMEVSPLSSLISAGSFTSRFNLIVRDVTDARSNCSLVVAKVAVLSLMTARRQAGLAANLISPCGSLR